MNKFEIAMVALLAALLLAVLYSQKQKFGPPAGPAPAGLSNRVDVAAGAGATQAQAAVAAPSVPRLETAETGPAAPAVPLPPERTVVVSNQSVAVTLSSWSGGITAVRLNEYRAALNKDSGPESLDFADAPALAWSGVPGLCASNDFEIAVDADGRGARVSRTVEALQLRFERTLTLGDGYLLAVTDTVSNVGSAPITLPAHTIGCGPMSVTTNRTAAQEALFLGLDTLPAYGGEGVKYWMKGGGMGCVGSKPPVLGGFYTGQAASNELPETASYRSGEAVAWVAAKNKFFVQLLAPDEASTSGCEMHARRNLAVGRSVELSAVRIAAEFPEKVIQPGQSSTLGLRYYVGPKKYAVLKALGNHQAEVMEFGRWFGWICKLLLPTLNWLYAVIPNYGVAIILLTILVRILFWPLTHKSTVDMKKMQNLQPLIAELRAKYKDKPQKLNQETMALYKEHKVNPMSGCLPMVVQIPVFFALFTVLRSAIELRFAPFLWIRDLSEQEGLFAGQGIFAMLPFVDCLNILPLIMTATTIWQQKLTPATGDQQQQKMMMLMPIFFLFLFYKMAAALVLYWTVSQLLAILQMVMQKRKSGQGKPAPA